MLNSVEATFTLGLMLEEIVTLLMVIVCVGRSPPTGVFAMSCTTSTGSTEGAAEADPDGLVEEPFSTYAVLARR